MPFLKREEVDEIGNMNTILEKCRFILRNIPQEWMLPKTFRHKEHASLGRIVNKENDAGRNESLVWAMGFDSVGSSRCLLPEAKEEVTIAMLAGNRLGHGGQRLEN